MNPQRLQYPVAPLLLRVRGHALLLLISKGLRGCPVCSQGRFSVGPEHVIISAPDPDTAEGAPVEGSAVVPVMCGNCGYTMLFSPRMLPDQGE